MGRKTLKAPEQVIFHAVRCWIEENMEGCDSDVVEDLVLSCVRLDAVPLDKLLGDVRESKLVSDGAILDAVNTRTERRLVNDSKANLKERYLTTRLEDLALESKTPKRRDFVRFKAS
jgi:hypothetical protein